MDYYKKTKEVASVLENYGAKTALEEVPLRKGMEEGFFYERPEFIGVEFILPGKENAYRIVIDKKTEKSTVLELYEDFVEVWIEETEDLEETLDKIIGEGVYL